MSNATGEKMLYETFFNRLEKARWSMNEDIPWKDIKKDAMTEGDLKRIKTNALIEFTALDATEAFLRDFSGMMDFSAFVSVWYYEEMKHFYVLKRYLEAFGVSITEEECQKMRVEIRKAAEANILTVHFIGEFRLALWYKTYSKLYKKEPVIKHIYTLVGNDEIRHGTCYLEYLKNLTKDNIQNMIAVLKTSLFMLRAQHHPTVLTGAVGGLQDSLKLYDHVIKSVSDDDQKQTYDLLFTHLSNLCSTKIQSLQDILTHLQVLRFESRHGAKVNA